MTIAVVLTFDVLMFILIVVALGLWSAVSRYTQSSADQAKAFTTILTMMLKAQTRPVDPDATQLLPTRVPGGNTPLYAQSMAAFEPKDTAT